MSAYHCSACSAQLQGNAQYCVRCYAQLHQPCPWCMRTTAKGNYTVRRTKSEVPVPCKRCNGERWVLGGS